MCNDLIWILLLKALRGTHSQARHFDNISSWSNDINFKIKTFQFTTLGGKVILYLTFLQLLSAVESRL